MLKEIWITRHGFREDWVNPTPSYPTHLPYDPPLSSFGLEQAKELGHFLKDKNIQRIYASPFYRVLQTVQPLTEHTQLSVHLDYAMSEWYGTAYETYKAPASIDLLQSLFPTMKIEKEYKSSIPLPIGSETELKCHERTKKGLNQLIHQLDSEEKDVQVILLAGHAASVICAVRGLLNDNDKVVKCGTCSLSRLIRRDNDSNQWDLVLNGDCHHLSKGEQRSWMFKGDIPDYEKKKMTMTEN
ncbi:unnamed protein product [Cunninghamella echinulata]